MQKWEGDVISTHAQINTGAQLSGYAIVFVGVLQKYLEKVCYDRFTLIIIFLSRHYTLCSSSCLASDINNKE